MGSKEVSKKTGSMKRNSVLRNVLMALGLIICFAMLAVGFVFVKLIVSVDVFSKPIVIVIAVIIVLLAVIFALTQRWLVPGIVTKLLAIAVTAVMVIGGGYIATTGDALGKISGVTKQIDHMGVYVMADSSFNKLSDLNGSTYGIISERGRENTDKAISLIEKESGNSVTASEYEEVTELLTALYNNEVDAVIINASLIPIVENVDGYQDIEEKTRQIWSHDIETEVAESETQETGAASSEDGKVFTLYLSGIDVDGPPTMNQNSDVNIIMVVNTNTRQILMINTPRDYYVPLSISNGVKDKLTHAGSYGVQVSVDTLEMLYDIQIDDYVKLNFTGFVNIIDQLGGIDVYSEYDFVSTHGGDHFVVGYNHADGKQALGFVRERYSFPTGDRQRGKDQMAVIQAVINKMTTTDALKNYNNILGAISDSMVTSMSYEEITDLIKMQLDDMRPWDIMTYSVDGTNDNQPCYSLKTPNYVMVPIQETVDKAKEYIKEMYAGETITVE